MKKTAISNEKLDIGAIGSFDFIDSKTIDRIVEDCSLILEPCISKASFEYELNRLVEDAVPRSFFYASIQRRTRRG